MSPSIELAHNAWFTINNVIKGAMGQPECRVEKKIIKKIRSPWRCVRKRWSEYRQGCHYYFFIHYFHNDCHYAQPLIEFHFASQVCGERSNYHLSDIKIHAKHFHGQSLYMFGKRTCSALIGKEKKKKKWNAF